MRKILYLGLDPTHCSAVGAITHHPVIQIKPVEISENHLQYSLKNFSIYTHVIITSKSTIKILQEYLPQFGYSMQDWVEKKTIAVGKITAIHLHEAGIIPAYVAKEEMSEGVIKELTPLLSKNHFFFWPHSSESRAVISNYLKNNQAQFNECTMYFTIPLMNVPAPSLNEFDEIIFTSPSTVQAFLRIYGMFPQNKILTSIGPITKACLTQYSKTLL